MTFSGGIRGGSDRRPTRSQSRPPEQLRSIAKLAAYDFIRVLPGHGRRFTAPSPAAMKSEVMKLA